MSTRYNTGNPIESTDVRDMSDNAKNFDEFSISTQQTFTDRLGSERLTIEGAIEKSGFKPGTGDFSTGFTVMPGMRNVAWFNPSPPGDNNWYSYIGEIPAGGYDVAPLTNPVGSSLWKPATDQTLRHELLQVGGADLVGYTSTKTVNDALISLDASAAQADSDISGLQGDVNSLSGKVDYLQEQLFISNSMSPSVGAKQLSAAWMNGLKGTVVLGDSISHGAFSGNIYSNGIMRLLARALNGKHGSESYGFIPISALGVGQPYESRDIQVSTLTGFSARELDLGSEYLPGIAYRSTTTGSKITMTVPSFQRRCIIHHANQAGGGSFTIKVNGVLSTTVDTSTSSDKAAATQVSIADDGFGQSTIEVETTNSLPVDIFGFSYVSTVSQHVLQNMSQSGRRARWLSSTVIDSACKDASTLIFALGYNDHSETDPAYIAAVTANIDTLIAKANQYGTDVVVPDFIWTANPSNWMRVQLKRLADETGGVYVPFAEYLKQPNGSYATSSHLINTLKMWVDGAHPNVDGCSWIFSMIAKAMNLSCTSKRQALEQFDWWMSLRLNTTIMKNILGTLPSSVKRTSSGLALRFFLANSGGGVVPTGTYDIATSYPPLTDIITPLTQVVPLLEDSAAVSVGNVRISGAGAIRIRITTTPTVANLSLVAVS